MFNPSQTSTALAFVGLRSYWLWWIAPVAVASALRERNDRNRVIMLLSLAAIIVGASAAVQFAMPASAQTYALYEGEEIVPVAAVESTGRARVSSTFAYISGFSDFVILVPAVLLSLGLNATSRLVRLSGLVGTAVSAAVMPMTGSRGPVVLAVGTVLLVILGAGLGSRAMRRAIVATLVAVGVAYLVAPEAIEGVHDRFEGGDTRGRFSEALELLPPVAMNRNDYPVLGAGTGAQHNARVALRIRSEWESEGEPGRYLIEQGVPGYLLIWFARLGLAMALLRAARVLRRAGRGAVAGAANAYAFFSVAGNLTFDHVFQALFFLGAGLILAEYVEVRVSQRRNLTDVGAATRESGVSQWAHS
jgi:hypothetical protein